jgi:hypothetical protein
MWCPVLWKKFTNVSEEHTASIFWIFLKWRRSSFLRNLHIILPNYTGSRIEALVPQKPGLEHEREEISRLRYNIFLRGKLVEIIKDTKFTRKYHLILLVKVG